MKLYMAVTADRYELPIAVRETSTALANVFHTTKQKVEQYINKGIPCACDGVKFMKITVPDGDYEDE